jgi:hypothetical protein
VLGHVLHHTALGAFEVPVAGLAVAAPVVDLPAARIGAHERGRVLRDPEEQAAEEELAQQPIDPSGIHHRLSTWRVLHWPAPFCCP